MGERILVNGADTSIPQTQLTAGGAVSVTAAGLRQVLDLLPDGVLLMDREWRLTYANEKARSISRIREEDLNGPTHWDLYPATVGTEQETKYRRVMEQRVEEELEFFYPPFQIWVHLRAMPVDGGIAVFYQDVTPLRKARGDAEDIAQRLQQVFDVTTDAIVGLNREWQYTFLNRRAKELLGVGDEVLGEVLWHRFPEAVYPESPFVENYYRTMNQGEPTSFEAFYPAPLNLWLRLESQPTSDGIVVFFRNITQMKQREALLHTKQAETERQRAELEAVYQTAPVGLALFEPEEFRYLRVNNRQSEVLGQPEKELLGKRIEDVVVSDEVPRLFRERVLRGEPVRDHLYETELRSRPGDLRSFNVNYSPVFDQDGKVRAISAAVLEVTQLRRAQMALLQNEKLAAVGRLAASISHEINNPLEAVTNLIYLAAHTPGLPAEAADYLRSAQDELVRVSQIATQTLRFHRQANKPTRVTPAQLVDAVLNLYAGRLVNSDVRVEVSYSTATQILCFENDIRQVLNNLIGNALDAMRSGGRLLVRAHAAKTRTGAGVRITIADTGSGMTAETRARLFEPFYTTKGLNGNGLGLWISKEIMVRHHGTLTLRSNQHAKTHGTVFALFLPCEPAPGDAPVMS